MKTSRAKVAFIGMGKRMQTVHLPLIKKMQAAFNPVGFTCRNPNSGQALEDQIGLKYYSSISDFASLDERPDFFICAVPGEQNLAVAKEVINIGIPLLLETPILDHEVAAIANHPKAKVAVLEQWPRLPIEAFKSRLFQVAIYARPFMVMNDCRSFNYHAMAQLRNYIGRDQMPMHVNGMATQILGPEFLDNSNNIRNEPEAWEMGMVRFGNGAILSHSFSYHCKTAPFRSIQTLRSYSVNGTFTTGKHDSSGDDYQILDFRVLENSKTRKMEVVVEKDKQGNVARITDAETNIYWKNPFVEFGLDDQETAIASIFRDMTKVSRDEANLNLLHTCQDSYIDNMLIGAIKHAAHANQVLSFAQG
jgi:hypothetical protein